MDDAHDEDSETEWANLAQKRYQEIKSGEVETLNWDTIKRQVLSKE